MKKLVALVLFLLSVAAHAAAPALSGGIATTPSSLSGTAPACFFFDASHATDADLGNKAFIGLLHRWNFGDSASGWWSTGARLQSKNTAVGPVAAHCYENAGTYTVTSTISDGTTTITPSSVTITVTAADTTYSGTATMCIANGALPVAGSNGCPTGAAVRQGTGDFDADVGACATANTKRCLFRRGDTFDQSATVSCGSLTGIYIGSYGSASSALPAVRIAFAATPMNAFTCNGSASGWKVVDIKFFAATQGWAQVLGYGTSSSNSDFVFLRVEAEAMLVGGSGHPDADFTNFFAVESNQYNHSGGNAFYARFAQSAILGGTYGPVIGTDAEHIIRLQNCKRCVVSSNTATGPYSTTGKHALTLRAVTRAFEAATTADSFFTVISNNKFVSATTGGTAEVVTIHPSANDPGIDERIYDVIFERNVIVGGPATTTAVRMSSSRVSVRNNIADLSLSSGTQANCFVLSNFQADYVGGGGSNQYPTPSDNFFDNNTCYSPVSDPNTFFIILSAHASFTNAVSGTTIRDNLWFSPNDTNGATFISETNVTGTTGGSGTQGNTSNVQAVNTNPFTTTPASTNLLTFACAAAAYCASGGSATNVVTATDFFDCVNTAGPTVGAVIPVANRGACADQAYLPIRLSLLDGWADWRLGEAANNAAWLLSANGKY